MARDVKFTCDACGRKLVNYNGKNTIVVELGEPDGKQKAKDIELEKEATNGNDRRRYLDLCSFCLNNALRYRLENATRHERIDFLMYINKTRAAEEEKRKSLYPQAESAEE